MEEMPAALGRMVPPEMCVPLEPQNGREGLRRCSQLRVKMRSIRKETNWAWPGMAVQGPGPLVAKAKAWGGDWGLKKGFRGWAV